MSTPASNSTKTAVEKFFVIFCMPEWIAHDNGKPRPVLVTGKWIPYRVGLVSENTPNAIKEFLQAREGKRKVFLCRWNSPPDPNGIPVDFWTAASSISFVAAHQRSFNEVVDVMSSDCNLNPDPKRSYGDPMKMIRDVILTGRHDVLHKGPFEEMIHKDRFEDMSGLATHLPTLAGFESDADNQQATDQLLTRGAGSSSRGAGTIASLAHRKARSSANDFEQTG